MSTALFLDFEDSFSYNVVQELEELGLQVQVVNWRDFPEKVSQDLLVLGPGPGHPDDYQILWPALREWMKQGKKIFGICLGHQLLWRLLGAEVERSSLPLHGQKVELKLSKEWQEWLGTPQSVFVQRYNSLAVKLPLPVFEGENFIQDGEVVMSRSSQLISYQFHPESVGTMCRRSFFNPILRDLL